MGIYILANSPLLCSLDISKRHIAEEKVCKKARDDWVAPWKDAATSVEDRDQWRTFSKSHRLHLGDEELLVGSVLTLFH